jgi:hypothetical protein
VWRFSIIGLLLALIATPDPLRGEGRSAILSPTDADPAQVDSGSFLRLTVRMLLPLTPPPGVQSDQV